MTLLLIITSCSSPLFSAFLASSSDTVACLSDMRSRMLSRSFPVMVRFEPNSFSRMSYTSGLTGELGDPSMFTPFLSR